MGACAWLDFKKVSSEMPVLNANSIDPDQTLRSVASGLGLHYSPMFLL